MKKTIRGKELEALLESIHKKNPKGILVIDSEFEYYLSRCDFQHLLTEVVSGKISNQAVITDTVEVNRKLIQLAQKDILNALKCTLFIQRKFPHAFFSSGNFSIGVHNLTRKEINICLAQKRMKFTYYKD